MRGPAEVLTDLFLEQASVMGSYVVALLLTVAILRWLPRARARADQNLWTNDMRIDLIFSLAVVPLLFVGLDLVEEHWIAPYVHSLPWLASYRTATAGMPLGIQIVLAILVKEFLGYGRHRLMHWGPLWRFHSIHHAPEDVDFATSARFHPGELVGTWLVAILTTLILKIEGTAAGVLFSVIAIQQLLLHANLRWTYGPLGWIFNSPAAHRWHHHPEVGKDHNFAVGLLTVFDLLFGTFHLPPGECPTVAGTDSPMPKSFWRLMRHPFERDGKESVVAPPNTSPA
jgi:sterol desaturase/sphingolipid hydroxylase (fatty acid hydroxylase superfamily)